MKPASLVKKSKYGKEIKLVHRHEYGEKIKVTNAYRCYFKSRDEKYRIIL